MPAGSGDILRIVAKCEMGGQDVINVFHAQMAETGEVDDSTILTAVRNRLEAAYQELEDEQSDQLTAVGIDVANITDNTVIGQTTLGAYTGGTAEQGTLPPQVAGFVQFGTQVLGSLGRKFLAGFIEDSNTETGRPDTAVQAVIAAFAAEILAPLLIGSGFLNFGNWNKDLERFVDWVSATVSSEWKTQRRRYYSSGS